VPLGALLLLAAAVGEALVGGDGEFGDGRALRRGADLRIFAEAADENDFVDASRPVLILLFECRCRRTAPAIRSKGVWVEAILTESTIGRITAS
jgi:hypothetical protein